jgi:3-hydroxymyristoyl/3-hydroxydecanoyl-(acyl carrier protein) dehydratase
VEKQPQAAVTEKTAMFREQHIDAFAKGSLSDCFGPDYDIYDDRIAPRTPNGDLQLISRVLSVDGERHNFKQPSSLVSEYDVPADVWFYRNSAYPVIPYSMIMEIALQPCGFLSTYMGATMLYPDSEMRFRNLSSDATLISDPDLRGKTITAYAELLNVSKAAETIVLNFNYALDVEGQRFYQGVTQFGYFTPHALGMQKGLDRGEKVPPWSEVEKIPLTVATEIELSSDAVQEKFCSSPAEKPYYRLNGPQLDFLDSAWVFSESGKYGQGYILATKAVDPSDWFYPCHFYQDPVMPGSLGVEGIIQCMRIFAIQQDLGRGMRSPRFVNVPGLTRWFYRGQITPDNESMDIEVHIKKIERSTGQVVILADANLWKNKMRIYEVTDVAIALMET